MAKYTGPPRTDLERFMRLVGASTNDVAGSTKLSQATVWRAMAGRLGSGLHHRTYDEIAGWADAEARRRKLPKSQWLKRWFEVAA